MAFPKELKYAESHEWLRVNGEEAYIGITDFAVSELNDLIYIEIEVEGETLETLVVTGEGEYKVSVRLSANAHSRIVTAPLKVEKTTALKPGARVAHDNSAGAANLAKPAQRFDAQGRALNARGPSHQKVYRKR